MLPFLRKLECRSIPRDKLPHLAFLLNPSLEILVVDFHPTSASSLADSLSCFLPSASFLQELHIDTNLIGVRSSRVCPVLAQFSHLRCLSIKARTAFSYETLRDLSSLPRLTSLEMDLPKEMPLPLWSPLPKDEGTFPSLTRLLLQSLGGDTTSHIARCSIFLGAFRPTALRYISITGSFIYPAESLQELFLAISETVSHECLERVNVSGMEYATMPKISLSVLEPLTQFRNLRALSLTYPCIVMDLDDHAFTSLSTSWRKLQVFDVSGWLETETKRRPTMNSLATLAKNCPDLRYISYTFDAHFDAEGHSAENEWSLDGRPCLPSIRELYVRDSRIPPTKTPEEVATVLLRLFPNLMRVSATRQPVPWKRVQDLLPILRGAM